MYLEENPLKFKWYKTLPAGHQPAGNAASVNYGLIMDSPMCHYTHIYICTRANEEPTCSNGQKADVKCMWHKSEAPPQICALEQRDDLIRLHLS